MGRPKGSKNKSTIQLEELQKRIDEYEKQFNSYDEVIEAFTQGFVVDLYNNGTIKNIDGVTLQKWLNSPDEYMQEITSLLSYYYIIDGSIFQLYDLIFSLPQLSYKITAIDKDDNYKSDIKLFKKMLKKINHKSLTRDLISQLASKGTLLGTWLGTKNNSYFYVFDDLEYVYPYGRSKGNMIGVIDLEWFNDMSEIQKQAIFENLSPLVTKAKYNAFINATDNETKERNRYITLPSEKSLVERIHTLSRNQRLGVPFGVQALPNILHKQTLKSLEMAIANKIIRTIALLKLKGKDDNGYKVKKSDKEKVYKGVKAALEKNDKSKDGLTVIAIPDFAEFSFPEYKNSDKLLSPDKYESVNAELQTDTGVASSLTNASEGTYASGKLNLDILYTKIGVLLEKVEVIYNQLFVILLGERGENYTFEYIKDPPLNVSTKLKTLKELTSNGYAVKPVLELLGIDSDDYFEETYYEIEELNHRRRIVPPPSSYTLTGSDNDGGTEENMQPLDEGTENSQENNGNGNPKANV